MTISKEDYSKRLVWIWVLGFVGLTIILGSVNCVRLFKLYREGVQVDVIVKETSTEKQPTVKYSFVVDGMSYDGEDQEKVLSDHTGAVKVGEHLRGYYQNGNPSVSGLGEPAPQLLRDLAFTLFWAIFVPTLLVFRASRRYKKWSAEQAQQPPSRFQT
jgi:hypothetical protein